MLLSLALASEGVLELKQPLKHPVEVNAVSRLLELGILSTHYTELTLEVLFKLLKDKSLQKMVSYKITPFGNEVLKEVFGRIL